MINFRSASYVTSCPDFSFRPKDHLPEVVFLGRSNVGKSSLINALTGQKIAYSSKNAGKTRYLNYFLIDQDFYLVDSPGYGYTAYGNKEDASFSSMMESYFANPLLKGAVLLLDSRRGVNDDDRQLLGFLRKRNIPTALVFTKADAASQSELAACRQLASALGCSPALFSKKGGEITELRKTVADFLH
jgi:GTP-binding protein